MDVGLTYRKLAELGYKRSAQKCKEKFENVNKYYKRTKEGRASRQDGKSYRFFSQLEAFHKTGTATTSFNVVVSSSQPTATTTLDVSPVSIGNPIPVSSVIRFPLSTSSMFPPDLTATMAPAAVSAPPAGFNFSSTSNGSSTSGSSQEDEPSYTAAGSSRKRKRQSSEIGTATRGMMEFFEGLMKHVMQKQEAMQHRFLEVMEKREHDRMIREEAWKRQEMARLIREHELMAQERSISASRDAAIISFLQKITGQTIQFPPSVIVATVPQPPPPAPAPAPQPQATTLALAPIVTVSTQQPPRTQPAALVVSSLQQNKQEQEQQPQHQQVHHHISAEAAMTLAQEQEALSQEISSFGSLEPSSTRWPKAEVLALIKLRSGLESKYQEVGPKGPLWEEISADMQRMGYKRSAKRCKEKWENINKYFKKVKESNKKRPEDAKTCPYFHELDALYRKKILASSSGFVNQNKPEGQQQQQQQKESATCTSDPLRPAKPDRTDDVSASELQSENGGGADVSLFGEGNGGARAGAAKKPEDIVKEFIKLQGTQKPQQQLQQQQLVVQDYGKIYESDDSEEGDIDEDGNDDDDEEDEDVDDNDDDLEDERKMAYNKEFQRQDTSASNEGGSGAPFFLAIVQ